MACMLLDMVVDDCAERVEDTEIIGPASRFGGSCPQVACTASSTTPAGLSIACAIVGPACAASGHSPDSVDPARTNVLFTITYSVAIRLSEPGDGSCAVTTLPITLRKLVQMSTSTPAQPLTYACIIGDAACVCRFIDVGGTCTLVSTAAFCVDFISTTGVKQEVAAAPCPTPACAPFPAVACPAAPST